MSLKIRLARGGAKKRPYYKIVIADSRSPRDGRFIEQIGHWNPLLPKDSEERVVFDAEKAKAWIAKGAQPTDRVARFLSSEGVVEWKPSNNPNKAQPGKKAQERIAEREEKEKAKAEAAAEAEAAPAEEEAPAEEAPAEEAAAEEPAAEEAPAESADAPVETAEGEEEKQAG